MLLVLSWCVADVLLVLAAELAGGSDLALFAAVLLAWPAYAILGAGYAIFVVGPRDDPAAAVASLGSWLGEHRAALRVALLAPSLWVGLVARSPFLVAGGSLLLLHWSWLLMRRFYRRLVFPPLSRADWMRAFGVRTWLTLEATLLGLALRLLLHVSGR